MKGSLLGLLSSQRAVVVSDSDLLLVAQRPATLLVVRFGSCIGQNP